MFKTQSHDWMKYFDYVLVDAKKPIFFAEGTILRQIDMVCRLHAGLKYRYDSFVGGGAPVNDVQLLLLTVENRCSKDW